MNPEAPGTYQIIIGEVPYPKAGADKADKVLNLLRVDTRTGRLESGSFSLEWDKGPLKKKVHWTPVEEE